MAEDTSVADVEAPASGVADAVELTPEERFEQRFAALDAKHALLDSELQGVKGIHQRVESQLKAETDRRKSIEALLHQLDTHVSEALPVIERVRQQWKDEDGRQPALPLGEGAGGRGSRIAPADATAYPMNDRSAP